MAVRGRYDAVVVGAGVFGLAAAMELAARGHEVAVVDRFGSGHPATSSTGASRSIRIAYGEPFYVDLAATAIVRWQELERWADAPILHLTGQIDLGPGQVLEPIVHAVSAAGEAIDQLPGDQLRRMLPELAADETPALFHARAGTVMAEAGLRSMRRAAESAGVALFAPERVREIDPSGPVAVVTDRRILDADGVVVAAGPWSGELLDGLGLTVPLAPAVAQVTFLDAPAMTDRPGIVEWPLPGEVGVYGHPVPGVGYKVAFDAGSEGWSGDVEAWEPSAAEERRLLDWVERRMPRASRRVAYSQRHPWTMTPDSDFVVDRVGTVTLACGCSGHAFKFGPALGPLVADVFEGAAPHDLLRLDRPGLRGDVSASDAIAR